MNQLLTRSTTIAYYLITLLLIATPTLLVWQHYGMVRTVAITPRHPHAPGTADDRWETKGNSVATLEITKDAIILHCALRTGARYPLCKVRFLLGTPDRGLDLSRFDTIALDVRYTGKPPQSFKLHLLNFEPEFSNQNDWNSQRYNEAEIEPSPGSVLTMPINVLRTADWWRSAHKVPLSKNYARLDNVTAVEISTGAVTAPQDITIEIRKIEFREKWMSKTTLLMCLVSAWIGCGILGLSLGLLHFRANLSVTRSRLEHLATVDRERKAAEAAREAALAEAVGLARQRSHFLAQMSHELRTPLNAIIGYAQLLRRDRCKLTEQQENAGLATIHESGQHLLTLINDILDLARVEAGKMVLHPTAVHLRSFLQVVVDIVRVKAEEKGLAFSYELAPGLPDAVTVDETRLRQVLLNLLGNAVKFTDSGTVSLRVLPAPPAAGADDGSTRLRFEVADSGIGMNKHQHARLFQPFEQVADVRRREGGTGLGLAISQQLTHLMGGHIDVASEPGNGSTFSFELALKVADSGSTVTPSTHAIAGYEGERKRLLVVDDVAPNRAMLVDMLQVAGFSVAAVGSGLECLVLLDSFKPDLILMDVMMPMMDGNETTQRIRRVPAWSALPVIAVTASATREDEAKCLAAGANAFLAKPVERDVLLRAIGNLLSLRWIGGAPPSGPAGPDVEEGAGLVVPPACEIEALWQMTRIGSMREIRERANYLRTLNPAHAPFAARLEALAQGYHSKELAAFVARYRSADAVQPQ